jgi:DNA-binding NarL/FixJ family response regulator
MVIMDIMDDLADQKSIYHMSFEIITILMGFISVFSLLNRLRNDLIVSTGDVSRAKTEIENLRKEKAEWEEKNLKYIQGLSASIKEQFETWKLSSSEKEIALFLLKGLTTKEIAGIRDTSEVTVRQQSSAIYSKSGLRGKNELISFFLEDLLDI